MWPDHKRHSRRGGWHVPYGKRHRNTVRSGIHLQKVYSYLSKNRLQRKQWQYMWTVEDIKVRGCRPMEIKDKDSFLRDK